MFLTFSKIYVLIKNVYIILKRTNFGKSKYFQALVIAW